MNKFSEKISIIIPTKVGEDIKSVLDALDHIDYPKELVEVFVSYGFSPSRQRNEAVKKAKGEILYFLDCDSRIDKDALKRVVTVFSGEIKPFVAPQSRGFSLFPDWLNNIVIQNFFSGKIFKGEIGAVGGPSVWWQGEPFWALVGGTILESFFAHGQMAARYRPIGSVHRATEKELILCNLAIRRDIFRQEGGFHEALYPNEENEFLNRIRRAGYQLVYHPGIVVSRPRRQTFTSLLSAFFHYGRGRMEQIRIEGPGQSIPYLAPMVLFFYLCFLIFYHPWFAFLPLFFYFGLALSSALGVASRRKKTYLMFFLPLLFFIAHLTYAAGFLYGLSSDLDKKRKAGGEAKVRVVKIKSFGQSDPSKI